MQNNKLNNILHIPNTSNSLSPTFNFGTLPRSPLRTPSPHRKSQRISLISTLNSKSGLHRIEETPGDVTCYLKNLAPKYLRHRSSHSPPTVNRPPSPIPSDAKIRPISDLKNIKRRSLPNFESSVKKDEQMFLFPPINQSDKYENDSDIQDDSLSPSLKSEASYISEDSNDLDMLEEKENEILPNFNKISNNLDKSKKILQPKAVSLTKILEDHMENYVDEEKEELKQLDHEFSKYSQEHDTKIKPNKIKCDQNLYSNEIKSNNILSKCVSDIGTEKLPYKNNNYEYHCPQCQEIYRTESILNYHINNDHQSDDENQYSEILKDLILLTCPTCGLSFKHQFDLRIHLTQHFNLGNDQSKQSVLIRKSPNLSTLSQAFPNIFTPIPNPSEYVDSKCIVSEIYETLLNYAKTNNSTLRGCVGLCSPLDFIQTSPSQKSWSCGYKNIQMLCSAIMKIPQIFDVVFKKTEKIPSIMRIQKLTEEAWNCGWDLDGAKHFNHALTSTRKWIGATEMVVFFSYLGIKCKLFDFHEPTDSNGYHPRLMKWVQAYFTKPLKLLLNNTSPLLAHDNLPVKQCKYRTDRLPLLLQHQGHSRLIIGFQLGNNSKSANEGNKLLVLDPSLDIEKLRIFLKISKNSKDTLSEESATKLFDRLFVKNISSLTASQYQIVCFEGSLNSDKKLSYLFKDLNDYTSSKILSSIKIP
ncbi:unnamed protein product [Gordionus sp. m RMFG-2023]